MHLYKQNPTCVYFESKSSVFSGLTRYNDDMSE